eukprot:3066925-Amphidinium_carterae.2
MKEHDSCVSSHASTRNFSVQNAKTYKVHAGKFWIPVTPPQWQRNLLQPVPHLSSELTAQRSHCSAKPVQLLHLVLASVSALASTFAGFTECKSGVWCPNFAPTEVLMAYLSYNAYETSLFNLDAAGDTGVQLNMRSIAGISCPLGDQLYSPQKRQCLELADNHSCLACFRSNQADARDLSEVITCRAAQHELARARWLKQLKTTKAAQIFVPSSRHGNGTNGWIWQLRRIACKLPPPKT